MVYKYKEKINMNDRVVKILASFTATGIELFIATNACFCLYNYPLNVLHSGT